MPDRPVFLCGSPRSGTSILRGIVGSHGDIAVFPYDLGFWQQIAPRFADRDLDRRDVRGNLLRRIFEDRKTVAAELSFDAEDLEAELAEESEITCGLVFQRLMEMYAASVGRPRWGFKSPNTELHADEILGSYPEARMVQIVRDPRDTGASHKRKWPKGWRASSHAAAWARSLRAGVRNRRCHPDRYELVRYEDLVEQPKRVIRDVCEFLGVEFDDQMLNGDGHPGHGGGGNSSFGNPVEGTGVHGAAIGRFREALTSRELLYYEEALGSDMRLCGYEPYCPNCGVVWSMVVRAAAWRFRASSRALQGPVSFGRTAR